MKKRITPTRWIANSYDCVMPFGKYKGYTIRYIVDDDPSYILWLDEQNIVEFSKEIITEAYENDENDYDEDYDYNWPLDD